MRLRRAVGVALVVVGLVGAGAFALAESEDTDDFSAARLGDGMGEGSLWEMLTPEEKAATQRAGLDWAEAEANAKEKPAPEEESKLDKAGKVGFSLLAVGLSLAAAAAPFLLF